MNPIKVWIVDTEVSIYLQPRTRNKEYVQFMFISTQSYVCCYFEQIFEYQMVWPTSLLDYLLSSYYFPWNRSLRTRPGLAFQIPRNFSIPGWMVRAASSIWAPHTVGHPPPEFDFSVNSFSVCKEKVLYEFEWNETFCFRSWILPKSLLSIILSPSEFASLVSGVVSLGQNLKVEIESLNMQGSLNVDFKISY